MIVKHITFDLQRDGVRQIVHVKQNDKNTRQIAVGVTDDGETYELADGVVAKVVVRKPDNKQVYENCTIIDNTVYINITEQMTTVAGTAECEVQIFDDVDYIATWNFEMVIKRSPYSAKAIESTDSYNAVITALQEIETFKKVLQVELNMDAWEQCQDITSDYYGYWIQTVPVKQILSVMPEWYLIPAKCIPTEAERVAFNKVSYCVTDTEALTLTFVCYSDNKPQEDITVGVTKGVM